MGTAPQTAVTLLSFPSALHTGGCCFCRCLILFFSMALSPIHSLFAKSSASPGRSLVVTGGVGQEHPLLTHQHCLRMQEQKTDPTKHHMWQLCTLGSLLCVIQQGRTDGLVTGDLHGARSKWVPLRDICCGQDQGM